VSGSPPAAEPGPPPEPAPRWTPQRVVAALLFVAAATAGFLIGHRLNDDDARRPARERIAAGAYELRVPASWRPGAGRLQIAGLDLRDRVERSYGAGSALIVGIAAADDGTLLPPTLRQRLGAPAPSGAARIGRLEALRYDGLRSPGTGVPFELFASAVRGGALTAACVGADRRSCDAAVATLRLTDGAAYTLGPDRGLEAALAATVARLLAARDRGVATMRRAAHARGQASGAQHVAAAYGRAARRVERASDNPVSARARRRISAAMRQAAAAWRALARAARRASPDRYRRARARVAVAERAARSAVAAAGDPAAAAPAPILPPLDLEDLLPPPSRASAQRAEASPACPDAPYHVEPTVPSSLRGFVRVCATDDGRSMRVHVINNLAVAVEADRQRQSYTDVSAGATSPTAAVTRLVPRVSCADERCTVGVGGTLQVDAAEPVRITLFLDARTTAVDAFLRVAAERATKTLGIRHTRVQRTKACIVGVGTTLNSPNTEEKLLNAASTVPGCKGILDEVLGRRQASVEKRVGQVLGKLQKRAAGMLQDLALVAGKVLIAAR
jgi:hypothetical protein